MYNISQPLCGTLGAVQRMATPSSSLTMGEPHSGQLSGRWKATVPSGRLDFTTSRTSGIILPRFPDDYCVPDAHIQLVDKVLIVKRGICNGRAGEPHRLYDGFGREHTGPADLDDYVLYHALLALWRVFVRSGPARSLGGTPQLLALGQGVYLDDGAVYIVGKVPPALAYALDRGLAVLKTAAYPVRHRVKAEFAQGVQRFGVSRELAAHGLLNVENAMFQLSRGCDLRVLLAH